MIKIRTSVADIDIEYFRKNKVFDDATKNRIYDWEEFFRSKLILKLNKAYDDNWKLDFTQTPEQLSWMVDIKANDRSTAIQVKNIIKGSLKGFNIEAFYDGVGI
ncbi:hypothetical protein [uncultured Psychroserpens sp.]|uniref:hypothetical protein n=1 Tax=uncultured Psychroserpens sp. TaxID=255436 RepID=UPI002615C5B4|nr:hypothetical protein [uncultured Psychroserpens sp.]